MLHDKKPRQKINYLENKKSFWSEKKAFFIIFKIKGFSIAKNCLRSKVVPLSKYVKHKVTWIWPCTIVLFDTWWNMFIKFSKQIGNSFARIIQYPVKHLRWLFFRKSLLASEANSGSCQTYKIELFAKIVKNKKLTIFAKTSILGVWQGSEYASEQTFKVKNVLFLYKFKYQR